MYAIWPCFLNVAWNLVVVLAREVPGVVFHGAFVDVAVPCHLMDVMSGHPWDALDNNT